MKNQAVELISIGNELLSGRTLNSHAQTLGAALTRVGLGLSRDTTVPDDPEAIGAAVSEATGRVDLVVVSGGLGPTVDDITRDALAARLNRSVVTSPSALEQLHERYALRGYTVTPAAERQALVLDGAETLLNSVGAAPGERLDLPAGKTLFVLPGPPAEFAAVLEDHVIPWLQNRFQEAVPHEESVLTTRGIGECDIVTRLEQAGFDCPEVAIGFYPGSGKVEIRLGAPPESQRALQDAERTLRKLLHDHLV